MSWRRANTPSNRSSHTLCSMSRWRWIRALASWSRSICATTAAHTLRAPHSTATASLQTPSLRRHARHIVRMRWIYLWTAHRESVRVGCATVISRLAWHSTSRATLTLRKISLRTSSCQRSSSIWIRVCCLCATQATTPTITISQTGLCGLCWSWRSTSTAVATASWLTRRSRGSTTLWTTSSHSLTKMVCWRNSPAGCS